MFPDPHFTVRPEGLPRPDRRPLPRAGEIRLRVKRTTNRERA